MVPNITGRFSSWLGGTAGMGVGWGGGGAEKYSQKLTEVLTGSERKRMSGGWGRGREEERKRKEERKKAREKIMAQQTLAK